ncbi:uncharacterized protein [Onthophagus taurus]|uniref:uncharacterized protein n=1 Tax=Onthophagus taurus TaxID=166361 RepID=UPI000C2088DE|nr:uncharacterized protein LOC111423634 [Onthophagus taurus]
MEPDCIEGTSYLKDHQCKILNFRTQTEYLLQNAILMTEMGMNIKDKCASSERYVSYLRNLTAKAAKNVSTLQSTSKNFLLLAQKLVCTVIALIDNVPLSVNDQSCYNIKIEFEKLLGVIEKELVDIEVEAIETTPNINNLIEKIKYLEAKQKMSDNNCLQRTASVKSVKSDVDEKYPENLSRESLIDLNTVVNLPPVPEDIFTTCSNKPTRTSSLSSLKSMRKVKLFLQRAANHSDDEDLSSDTEEHEFPKIAIGDSLDDKTTTFAIPKKQLGNIKEESQY